ncbi:MAG: hypothetical protein ACTHPS_26030, partial [Streptosporangiaceae bacterium]
MEHPQLPAAGAGGAAAGAGDAAKYPGDGATTGSGPGGTPTSAAEEATMEEHFVWMTTRRIKPGTLTE